jgi:hypothetical protein
MAAELSPIWKRTLVKTSMVEEPSHVKQLSLNDVCKIGLIGAALATIVQVTYPGAAQSPVPPVAMLT